MFPSSETRSESKAQKYVLGLRCWKLGVDLRRKYILKRGLFSKHSVYIICRAQQQVYIWCHLRSKWTNSLKLLCDESQPNNL